MNLLAITRAITNTLSYVHRGFFFGLALIALVSCTPARTKSTCLSYEGSTLTLHGLLKEISFPGPPNYESISDGDKEERGLYLALDVPLCTLDRDSTDSKMEVGLIQLVLDSEGYKTLMPLVGQSISVKGALYARHTGHHHTPLLLDFQSINHGD